MAILSKDRKSLLKVTNKDLEKDGRYRIPGSVTKISSEAFRMCTNLSLLILSTGLTSIASDAFGHRNKIKKITIQSNSVIEINRIKLLLPYSLREKVVGQSISSQLIFLLKKHFSKKHNDPNQGYRFFLVCNKSELRDWHWRAIENYCKYCLKNRSVIYNTDLRVEVALADVYFFGPDKHYDKGIAFYKSARSKQNSSAMMGLGLAYYQGLGVKQNYYKAMSLFKEAAKSNNAMAMSALAGIYCFKSGCDQHFNEGVKLYQRAIKFNCPIAMYNLAIICQNNIQDYAIFSRKNKLYEQAAKLNYAPAINSLVTNYFGELEVKRNRGKAKWLYEKEITLKFSDTINNLALMHHYGIYVERDFGKARQLYERAVSLKNAQAMVNLANMYRRKKGIGQDLTSVKKLYEQAVKLNYRPAMMSLAYLYEYGVGIDQNIIEAEKLYTKIYRPKKNMDKDKKIIYRHCVREMHEARNQDTIILCFKKYPTLVIQIVNSFIFLFENDFYTSENRDQILNAPENARELALNIVANQVMEDKISLNETQRTLIRGFFHFILDDIAGTYGSDFLSHKLALNTMTAKHIDQSEVRQHKEVEAWDSIQQVRQIFSHPHPQNRSESYPYMEPPEDENYVVYKDKFGRPAFERRGLLSLTPRNSHTAYAITKRATIYYIKQIIKEKYKEITFKENQKKLLDAVRVFEKHFKLRCTARDKALHALINSSWVSKTLSLNYSEIVNYFSKPFHQYDNTRYPYERAYQLGVYCGKRGRQKSALLAYYYAWFMGCKKSRDLFVKEKNEWPFPLEEPLFPKGLDKVGQQFIAALQNFLLKRHEAALKILMLVKLSSKNTMSQVSIAHINFLKKYIYLKINKLPIDRFNLSALKILEDGMMILQACYRLTILEKFIKVFPEHKENLPKVVFSKFNEIILCLPAGERVYNIQRLAKIFPEQHGKLFASAIRNFDNIILCLPLCCRSHGIQRLAKSFPSERKLLFEHVVKNFGRIVFFKSKHNKIYEFRILASVFPEQRSTLIKLAIKHDIQISTIETSQLHKEKLGSLLQHRFFHSRIRTTPAPDEKKSARIS